jgi:hypothetical protein
VEVREVRTVLLATVVLALGVPAAARDAAPAPTVTGADATRPHADPASGARAGGAVERGAGTPGPGRGAEDGPVAGKVLRLRGRFLTAVVARIGADGSERIDCVTPDGAPGPHAGP